MLAVGTKSADAPCKASDPSVVACELPQGEQIKRLDHEAADAFRCGQQSFSLHRLLGEGSFGSVYLCSKTGSGEYFAVKVINSHRIAMLTGHPLEAVIPRMFREAVIHRIVGKHPNIVQLDDVFFSEESKKLYLVYEWLKGGDLFQAIVSAGRNPFSETKVAKLFRQLLEGVVHGHSKGVAHRDIKLENCILEDETQLNVKLCDYGQANFMPQDEGGVRSSRTLTTSAVYTAPDVTEAVNAAQPYDAFKADSFALGVLLYGMLCNALPKAAQGAQYQDHPRWAKLSDSAHDLIQKLLDPEPSTRISVEQALSHKWLVLANSAASPAASSAAFVPGPRVARVLSQEAQLNNIFAIHQVLVAVQRERGACLWAIASHEGGPQLRWKVDYTDQQCAEARSKCLQLQELEKESFATKWCCDLVDLLDRVQSCTKELRPLGKYQPVNSGERRNVMTVFQGYNKIAAFLGEGLAAALAQLRETSRTKLIKHKLLVFSAEQLGRERALLSAYLGDPECLRQPSIVLSVLEIIGARKMLLGSSDPSENASFGGTDVVIAGELGLLNALELMETQVLDSQELKALEEAENNALNPGQAAPAINQWFTLLTKLIDNVHKHVQVNMADIVLTGPSQESTPESNIDGGSN